MLIEKENTLVFQGDSITDAGRNKPIAEGNNQLGDGYPKYVDAFLKATYPELRIRVINTGISGNKTRELLKRWQEDTLDINPDWVSIMIGANDVWRQYDRPLKIEDLVFPQEYKANLELLVEKTLPYVKGIVLIGPFFMGQDPIDPMRQSMIEYASIVKDIAQRYNLVFADTQALFDEHMKHYHSHSISWDSIHPNHTGHMLIAKAFLNSIKFDWSRMK